MYYVIPTMVQKTMHTVISNKVILVNSWVSSSQRDTCHSLQNTGGWTFGRRGDATRRAHTTLLTRVGQRLGDRPGVHPSFEKQGKQRREHKGRPPSTVVRSRDRRDTSREAGRALKTSSSSPVILQATLSSTFLPSKGARVSSALRFLWTLSTMFTYLLLLLRVFPT